MPNKAARLLRKPVAKAEGLELGIVKKGSRGLGKIIDLPQSKHLIDGVQVMALRLHPDDRGFFEEIFRWGQGLARDLGSLGSNNKLGSNGSLQVSAALSYSGTVKAIHYHLHQTDLWTPLLGQFQVFLYDLRIKSPTFGKTNTLYVGPLRPWQILIPPGVGHGYKIVGPDAGLLVYATDRFYDPTDEGRIVWNDPDINYDWETQKK